MRASNPQRTWACSYSGGRAGDPVADRNYKGTTAMRARPEITAPLGTRAEHSKFLARMFNVHKYKVLTAGAPAPSARSITVKASPISGQPLQYQQPHPFQSPMPGRAAPCCEKLLISNHSPTSCARSLALRYEADNGVGSPSLAGGETMPSLSTWYGQEITATETGYLTSVDLGLAIDLSLLGGQVVSSMPVGIEISSTRTVPGVHYDVLDGPMIASLSGATIVHYAGLSLAGSNVPLTSPHCDR